MMAFDVGFSVRHYRFEVSFSLFDWSLWYSKYHYCREVSIGPLYFGYFNWEKTR